MVQYVEVGNIENVYSNPVAELVQTACKFESHITVREGGKYINAKSLMGMMAFGLKNGIQVEISADGTDEGDAVEAVKHFLACS
jgi:phosphocarrier protein